MVQADLMVKLLIGVVLIAIGYACGYLPEHNAFTTYRAQVEQAGRDQAAQSKATDERNRKLKEESDAQRKTLLAVNADLSRKLLNARSSGGYLPKASATASNPDRACFDRNQLDATIRFFDAGVQSLITEGDNSRIGIEVAKDWAKGIR